MVEPRVRALFAEQASSEPPPSRVSIGMALHRGRARLRRRGAAVAGAPVLAVAAIVAVVLTSGAAPGGSARAARTSGAAGGRSTADLAPVADPKAAPGQFDPLVPYPSFGWLPAGQALIAGNTGLREMYLITGPNGYALDVYSAGRCQLDRPARQLNCTTDPAAGQEVSITGRAPAVRGHRAFWASGFLVWQYARGGWALLSLPRHNGVEDRRHAARVAAQVRYDVATRPLIAFPAQLTHVPDRWQIDGVHFVPHAGVLRASQYSVTAGGVSLGSGDLEAGLPQFTTDPAKPGSCYFYPNGQSAREVIDGAKVIVNHFPAARGNPPGQQLCAAHADGLFVFISESGRPPALGVVAVFRHHLRLLGTDPANWTRTPIADQDAQASQSG